MRAAWISVFLTVGCGNELVVGDVPPRLLFGLGPEADGAIEAPLVKEAPVRMLSSWYNAPSDLEWLLPWREDVVPRAYAAGYALHVVVGGAPDDDEGVIATAHGSACGRPYPLSDRFLDDLAQVVAAFAGAAEGPPLYVTLFPEFQSWTCTGEGAWSSDPEATAYWAALKDRYRAAASVVHQQAPNGRVALCWGGRQARGDDPTVGSGRSFVDHFGPELEASDFQSFIATQPDSNVEDVRDMTELLGRFGPVMVAAYGPNNGSQTIVDADLGAILQDGFLGRATRDGLFAWSFLDDDALTASEATFARVRAAVARYAEAP